MLPFKASADVKWHHPLICAADPAARRLTATCHLGDVRMQPTFGHVGLLQALHQHLKAGADTFKSVRRCNVSLLLLCVACTAQPSMSDGTLNVRRSLYASQPMAPIYAITSPYMELLP